MFVELIFNGTMLGFKSDYGLLMETMRWPESGYYCFQDSESCLRVGLHEIDDFLPK